MLAFLDPARIDEVDSSGGRDVRESSVFPSPFDAVGDRWSVFSR